LKIFEHPVIYKLIFLHHFTKLDAISIIFCTVHVSLFEQFSGLCAIGLMISTWSVYDSDAISALSVDEGSFYFDYRQLGVNIGIAIDYFCMCILLWHT